MTETGVAVIVVPRISPNDDVVHVVQWVTAEGTEVRAGDPLAVLETTKTTFDLEAERDGYLFHLAGVGDEVAVGAPVAVISDSDQRPTATESSPAARQDRGEGPIVTAKARVLMEQHGLTAEAFEGLAVIRTDDVDAHLARVATPPAQDTTSAAADAEWNAVRESDDYQRAVQLVTAARQSMKGRFQRHVPVGDLFTDRWGVAAEYGFGEGSSVYDDSLILGDVTVGEHCWIGPFTVLDGAHAPLTIGDYTSIGAGSQVYTHATIEQALTGNRAPTRHEATSIAECCFIAPHVVIGPGTVIGRHSFVASGSYVEGSFEPFSYIAGCPATKVGRVEVVGDRARLIRES